MKKTTKQILKSFISFTLILALMLGALPLPQFVTEAKADSQTVVDSETTHWSGNMVVNSNVVINGYVALDGDTNLTIADGKTLTVNGYISDTTAQYGLAVTGGNLVVLTKDCGDSSSITTRMITITDSHVSITNNSGETGIHCSNSNTLYTSMIVNSIVDVKGEENGIRCDALTIKDNSVVTTEGVSYGINCTGNLTIIGSKVEATSSDSCGISCSAYGDDHDGTTKIVNSKVETIGESCGLSSEILELNLAATDSYFKSSKTILYYYQGTLKIEEGQTLTDGTALYSGTHTGDDLPDMDDSKTFKPVSPTRVAMPAISPAAGFYAQTQSVSLSCATSGASIYYTLDNTTPSESNGTLYTGPISVANTKTIKAIAIKSDMTSSYVTKTRYTISSVPVYLATITDGTGGGSYAEGQTVSITANAAPTGKVFAGWSGAEGLSFLSGSAASSTASFVMPANAVSLTASYKYKPTLTVSNITKTYDGEAVTASQISGVAKVNGSVIAGTWSFASGQSLTNVSDSGLKTVVFTPSDQDSYKTVSTTLNLTINPKVVDIPEAVANLTWTGQQQTGVADGEGYTLTYNEATDVGNYTATAKLESDNYIWSDNSNEDKTIPWSIGKANISFTAPALISNLICSGAAQPLITSGSASSATMYYALGENGTTAPAFDGLSEAEEKTWKITVPKGTNPGTYHVWYLVKGDGNHDDIEAACLEAVIKCRVSFEKGDDEATGNMNAVGVAKDGSYTLPASGFTAPEGKEWQKWSVRIGNAEPVEKAVGDVITIADNTVITAVYRNVGTQGTEGNPVLVDTWSDLYDALQNGGYVKLTGNVTFGAGEGENISEALFVPANKEVVLDLAGFSIDRGLADEEAIKYGNVISIRGKLTLNDSSDDPSTTEYDGTGKITGGNDNSGTDICAGGVLVDFGAVFTMNSGSITGNKSTYVSGVVLDRGSSFTMNGGKICNNTTTSKAEGSVGIRSDCTFTLNDGRIYGNKTAGYGGGVTVTGETSKPSLFTMNGGMIYGNEAELSGGGVMIYEEGATFKMTGGTISGNNAVNNYGGGVYNGSGDFEMTGGVITGNNASLGGGVIWGTATSSVSVSGNAVIMDNVYGGELDAQSGMYTGGTASNMNGAFRISGMLGDDACIGVNAMSGLGVLVNGGDYTITDADLAHFVTDDDEHTLVLDSENNNVLLKKYVKVSGIKAKNKPYDGDTSAELDYSEAIFEGLNEGDSLDVTATGTFENAAIGTGKTVSINGITLGGTDVDKYILSQTGQQTSATADILKKDIPTDTVTVPEANENLIYTGASQALITAGETSIGTMYYALGNNGETAPDFDGLSEAENKLWKTTVPNAEEPGTYYVWYLVKGNETYNDTEATCLEAAIKCKVSFERGAETATGTMDPDGVAKGTAYILPRPGFTAPDGKCFLEWSVKVGNADSVAKAVGDEITIKDNTVVIAVYKDIIGQGTQENPWQVDTWSDLCDAFQKGGYVKLTADVTYGEGKGANSKSDLTIPSGKEVTMDLAGHTIDRGLYRKDMTDEEAAGKQVSNGYVIEVSGNLTVIDDSDDPDTVVYDGTGRITGGNSMNTGGGVNVRRGTFVMKGGNIIENRTGYNYTGGGGVNVEGVFTMDDGVIQDNLAAYMAGGVSVAGLLTETVFTMNGGGIRHNIANTNGGGVFCGTDSALFRMNGGEIKGNQAQNGGGGIYGSGLTKAEITGGFIVGNNCVSTADSCLGGMQINVARISGNVVIRDNVCGGTMDETTGLYNGGVARNFRSIQEAGFTIVGKMNEDAEIWVYKNGAGVFAQSGEGYTLTEEDASCFFSDNDAYVPVFDAGNNALVMKKAVTVSGIKAKNKDYDGSRKAELDFSDVTITGVEDGDELTVSANGVFDTEDAGTGKTVTISNIMLGGADADKYALARKGQQTSASANIREVPIIEVADDELTAVYTPDDIFIPGLSNFIVMPAEYASYVHCSVTNGTGEGTYENNRLNVTKCGTFTITISGTETDSFAEPESEHFTLTVEKTSVTTPEITSKTYSGQLQTAEVPASTLYTVSGNDGGIHAGSYDVVLSLKDPDNYKWSGGSESAEKTLMFKITKRPITVTAGSASEKYDGSALTDNTYTYSENGLADGDQFASVAVTGSQTAVGSSDNVVSAAKIVNTVGQDVTANYDIIYVNGTLTVLPECDHKLAKTEYSAPTCSKEGNIAYWTCSECKKVFSDALASNKINMADTVIAKIAHTPAQAVSENSVPATCVSDGSYDEVVKCTKCGEILSTTHKTIKAYGHAYGTPSYEWSTDGKQCNATATCTNDDCTDKTEGHSVTETATVTSKVKQDATTTEKGITTYTAAFKNKCFSTQTKDIADIPVKQNGSGDSGSGDSGSGNSGTGGNGTDNGNGNGTSGNGTGNGTGGNGTSGGSGNGNNETPGKQDQQVKVGDIVTDTVTGAKVKITSDKSGKETAEYVGLADKNAKSAVVPDTVTIGGKTYKITTVRAYAFKGSNVTKITLGKYINKLSPKAFNGSKVTTIIAKTTKLTKKSVKNCLKGTKAKKVTIKVKVGSKTKNKKYRNLYKKYFTAKNAGKKATVK